MSWRPTDWDNDIDLTHGYRLKNKKYKEGFEAGADAMLKAIVMWVGEQNKLNSTKVYFPSEILKGLGVTYG